MIRGKRYGYRKSPFTELGNQRRASAMFTFARLLRQVTASKVLIDGATVPARPCRDASRVTPAYSSKMLHTSLQLGEPLVAHARQQTNVELEIRANSLCSPGAVPLGLSSLLHSVRRLRRKCLRFSNNASSWRSLALFERTEMRD